MNRAYSYLAALLMGVALFYFGWTGVTKTGLPFVDENQTTLVVRPAQAETGWDGAVVKDPDAGDPLGTRYIPAEARELTAQRDSWGTVKVENARAGGLRTVRLTAPPAKLDPRTSDGTAVELAVLPDKKKQPRKAGYIRIAPGKYKFLATAEGHIPKAVDLSFSAGEVKKLTIDLKKLPIPPRPAPPAVQPPTVSQPPPVRYPVRAAPPSRPQYRPQPQPQPRFTPVDPKPAPRVAQPVPEPVFTPFP